MKSQIIKIIIYIFLGFVLYSLFLALAGFLKHWAGGISNYELAILLFAFSLITSFLIGNYLVIILILAVSVVAIWWSPWFCSRSNVDW